MSQGLGARESHFYHDDRVSSDNDHSYPDLLTACLLLQRIVQDNVQVDLSRGQYR
jgi:hypothetical protein